MKKLLIVAIFCTGLSVLAQPKPPTPIEEIEKLEAYTDTPDKQAPSFEATIIAAFKAGNAKKIALYFAENVDFSLLGKENLYSKSQAEHILKDFFTNHPPSDFKILHKGKSGQSDYMIGNLTSNEKVYRVKLNTKTLGGVQFITSLSIEEV